MPKFFNTDMADLTHQLTLSPRRQRMEQIRGIDRLLGLVEAERAYPFDFVCYHITGYRKRGSGTSDSIPGSALVEDLVTMAEVISRKAALPVVELGESYQSHQEVADALSVSTKTVRRWRSHGLMGIRVVFEDGVNRLAFLKRTVDRFIEQNAKLVNKGASFRQLTTSERDQIIARARQIITAAPTKLHTVAKQVAEETGRAVETIRYTLRRFDESNADQALFAGDGRTVRSEREAAIWRCHQAGDSVEQLASAFDCSVAQMAQTVRAIQVQIWQDDPPDCVTNELFDVPNADAVILDVPEPEGRVAQTRVPSDLPSYLQALYRTPLLTKAQEQDLFRRYNYLKFKARRLLDALEPATASAGDVAAYDQLIGHAEGIKQRIIQANLRLVVSIAKRHVGWSNNFYEVISDGNVSLMRAVEKFDYALGNKFSTYGTWAIMKNFARSIPEAHYHGKRFVTGQDELLDAEADRSGQTTHASDRIRVRELIAAALAQLPQRDREIVAGHFDLAGNGTPSTLEQLGKRFGITKERVRQIEQKALAQLRAVLSPSLADAIGD